MANVLLTLLNGLGVTEVTSLGDSTGTIDLTGVPSTTEMGPGA
jgi:hypothetical protein